jgi:methyl-accepting chemotaxis protein
MQWFRNRRTVTKLMMGFGLLALLMCVLGYVGSYNITALNDATLLMYDRHMLGLNDLNTANLQLVEAGKSLRNALLAQDPKEREGYLGELTRQREAFLASIESFQKRLVTDEMKTKTASMLEEYRMAAHQQDRVVELIREGRPDLAMDALVTLNTVNQRRNQLIAELSRGKLELMKRSAETVESTARRALIVSAAVVIFAVVLALVLGTMIARLITRPLGKMVEAAGRLAAGDVDQRIEVQSADETGQLAEAFSALISTVKGLTLEVGGLVDAARQGKIDRRGDESKFAGGFRELVRGINDTLNAFEAPIQEASSALTQVAQRDLTARMDGDYRGDFAVISNSLNKAVTNLCETLVEVRGSADGVSSTAESLSAATEQISSGAQEQAASLEEMSASLQEMTATVRQNAENARQASQLAAGSRVAAEQGGEIVAHAVAAMGEINQASRQIGDIITTIDEIAFQTNLLALNAAVEAARAGEQGRGFAVVAAEVRSLAQRSATAAREIKGLIQNSVQKVESGSELVNRSGQALVEIVLSVKRVTDLMSEIAAASVEQSSGIDQVNTATIQLNQVTQANASQTEELSSTAEALSSSAAQLQSMVARFELGGEDGTRTAAARKPVGREKARHSAEETRKRSALASLAKHLSNSAENVLKEC